MLRLSTLLAGRCPARAGEAASRAPSGRRPAGAGADTLLGPEMRSTGEVMGIDRTFAKAYAKAAIAGGQKLPSKGNVFLTMTDKYKPAIIPIAQQLQARRRACTTPACHLTMPFVTSKGGFFGSSVLRAMSS